VLLLVPLEDGELAGPDCDVLPLVVSSEEGDEVWVQDCVSVAACGGVFVAEEDGQVVVVGIRQKHVCAFLLCACAIEAGDAAALTLVDSDSKARALRLLIYVKCVSMCF